MRISTSELHKHLLSIIESKDEVIKEQNDAIKKLLNENAEQENMINTLMRERL